MQQLQQMVPFKGQAVEPEKAAQIVDELSTIFHESWILAAF